jgi:hypothetical protein
MALQLSSLVMSHWQLHHCFYVMTHASKPNNSIASSQALLALSEQKMTGLPRIKAFEAGTTNGIDWNPYQNPAGHATPIRPTVLPTPTPRVSFPANA